MKRITGPVVTVPRRALARASFEYIEELPATTAALRRATGAHSRRPVRPASGLTSGTAPAALPLCAPLWFSGFPPHSAGAASHYQQRPRPARSRLHAETPPSRLPSSSVVCAPASWRPWRLPARDARSATRRPRLLASLRALHASAYSTGRDLRPHQQRARTGRAPLWVRFSALPRPAVGSRASTAILTHAVSCSQVRGRASSALRPTPPAATSRTPPALALSPVAVLSVKLPPCKVEGRAPPRPTHCE